MHVVALVELRTSVEAEAPHLAPALGTTAYEAGLLLRAAPPVVLLRTEDRDRATTLLGALRGRGHEVVAFDDAAVVASAAMTSPRPFRFEGGDLVASGAPEGAEPRLPLADVFAVVRAVHQSRTESTTTTKEKQTSLTCAALTGGLVRSKTVEKQTSARTEEREPVAYLFRAGGEPPWLLAASRLRYDALAPHLAPSQNENFETLLRMVKERAPAAAFDTRLLALRSAPENIRSVRAGEHRGSSAGHVDVLAHIVALALHRR